MSETIKLPPIHENVRSYTRIMLQEYATQAVEQATAELRSKLSAALARVEALAQSEQSMREGFDIVCDNYQTLSKELSKIQAERDAALAKVARYETLRPASEYAEPWDYPGLWWYLRPDGSMSATLGNRFDNACGWTPLPDVKEPTP
jgi:hypothetical protein